MFVERPLDTSIFVERILFFGLHETNRRSSGLHKIGSKRRLLAVLQIKARALLTQWLAVKFLLCC